jgi:YD repeat-containing protein
MPDNSRNYRVQAQFASIFRPLMALLFAMLLAPRFASAASEGMLGWVHEVGLEGRFAPDPATACKGYDGPYGRTLISMERHTSTNGEWDGTAYRCHLVHLDVPGQPRLYRVVDLMCESGYHKRWPGVCVKGPKLPDQPPSSCPYSPGAAKGNPVLLADGAKFQKEVDLRAAPNGALDVDRFYRSRTFAPQAYQDFSTWKFSFEIELRVPTAGTGMPTPVTVLYPDQTAREFNWKVNRYIRGGNAAETLTRVSAERDEWLYKSSAGRLDRFQKINGRYMLVSSHSKEGVGTYLDHSDAPKIKISDDHGRTLIVSIERGLVVKIEGASLSTWYLYEVLRHPYLKASRLVGVAFEDEKQNILATRYFEYKAEDTGLASQFLLTGIIDENDARYANYAYDDSDRAILSEHAGANRYDFSYPSDSIRVVRDPLGTERQYTMSIEGDRNLVTAISQPAGAGCEAAATQFAYSGGNVSSILNFNGGKTCKWHSGPRRLEIARVEGKAALDGCGTAQSLVGAGQRKISTQWHPEWGMETAVAGPLKRTNYIFNGQPDLDGKIVECAGGGKLPNGQPIAVLCKKIEQATSDTNGSKGFSAAPVGAPRVSSFTYNQLGQILSETVYGRTGSNGDTWRFVYHTDTTATHTTGDLWKHINPKGHITEFLEYTTTGLPTRVKEPDGTITISAYDPRGNETLRVDAAGTPAEFRTETEYDRAGQVTRVTRGDGTTASYRYDDAHRLIEVTDGAGNQIQFALDGMGNRLSEEIKNADGKLIRRISRSYDALNRLKEQSGGEL